MKNLLPFVLSFCALVGGCTSTAPTPPTATATATLPPATPEITATPHAEETPAGTLRLMLWIPEPLAPLSNPAIAELLNVQIAAFEEAQGGAVEVEWRMKRVSDAGGIMSTLRNASAVAPGAVPDLTLMRREDLVTAVQGRMIQPLEGRIASGVLGDLFSSALLLGQVDETLYGLPYLLDVRHLMYRTPDSALYGWRFRDVLSRDLPLTFPARRANGVADMFLVQYLNAALNDTATLAQISSAPLQLDIDALRSTLAFYESAVAEGLISPAVLDYSTPLDYLRAQPPGLMLVTSTQFLSEQSSTPDLSYAPIPTESGRNSTMLNGWIWVMPATNTDRQQQALNFLNWMLDAERQREFARAVTMLPSQRTPLRAAADSDYSRFVTTLLENTALPLTESSGGLTARALQNALVSVLLGERTADEATQDVIEQLTQ